VNAEPQSSRQLHQQRSEQAVFDFITISNGVAVIQHRATGNVYRFRPVHPGTWQRLSLDRTDFGPDRTPLSDHDEGAALQFAEDHAGLLCSSGPGIVDHSQEVPR
jgi:hypothetical protein